MEDYLEEEITLLQEIGGHRAFLRQLVFIEYNFIVALHNGMLHYERYRNHDL